MGLGERQRLQQIFHVDDAQIDVPGRAAVRLRRFDIPGPSDRVWPIAQPVIMLALSPPFRSLASQATMSDTGPVYELGDLFFMPVGELHFRGAGGKTRTVGISYDGVYFETVTGFAADGKGCDPAAYFDITDPALHQSMRYLARELDNPGYNSEALVDALTTAILVHFSRTMRLPRAEGASPAGGLSSWQLRRIRQRLEDPEAPPPPVTELAQLCNLSGSHLSRAFKQSTGQTLYDYIRAAGIRKAEHFLLDTEMPLKSIAHLLGFASQATFSMAFRNATGQTPSDYRQQFRRARQGGAK